MLQLILQRSKALRNLLALFLFRRVGFSGSCAVHVIDRSSLQTHLGEALMFGEVLLTIITGHRSRAEKKAKEVWSPVFDCAGMK